MTVAELIEKLKDIPGDTEVVFCNSSDDYSEQPVNYVDYLDAFNEVQLSK
jgi:hypothetical protein